jgi:hypothetical protein
VSGETKTSVSGWTIDTFAEYSRALREADLRFDAERDRRLAEVAVEREKALAIKEKADERALSLSAETQKYKDEKANELRSQIERERGSYITQDKFDAVMKPVLDYIAASGGRDRGAAPYTAVIFSVVSSVLSALAVGAVVVATR